MDEATVMALTRERQNKSMYITKYIQETDRLTKEDMVGRSVFMRLHRKTDPSTRNHAYPVAMFVLPLTVKLPQL